MNIKFELANLAHKDLIFAWLEKPHVKEFWDNSPLHREDILIFMHGRQQPSNYFNGRITYWVGSINEEPYCFLLTSSVIAQEEKQPLWKDNASATGHTICIDFCIGNEKYLGKGLAAKTLTIFTTFFTKNVDNKTDTFFIDPDENNPRARHVYEKAGFIPVGEFVMEKGFFAGQQTLLMVKRTK